MAEITTLVKPLRPGMRAARWAVVPVLLGTALVTGTAAAPVTRSPVDPGQDSRLGQRVRLRSAALPLGHVVKTLGEATGVALSVTGPAADERVVVFVPEASLAEVMGSLAELYRLNWLRGGTDRHPTYRLQKPLATSQEEETLRRRAVQEVLDRLSQRLRRPGTTAGPEPWAGAYPEVLPWVAQLGPSLHEDGFASLPLGVLPAPVGDRLRASIAPILQAQDERRDAVIQGLQEEERKQGVPEDQLSQLKPRSRVDQCTVTLDLHVPDEIRVSVGLRTETDTWYNWFEVLGSDLRAEGLALYQNRNPNLPSAPGRIAGGPSPATGSEAADAHLKAVQVPPPADGTNRWVETLGRLSDAAGVPIYADYYLQYRQGRYEQPRASMPKQGSGSVKQFLDALCFPEGAEGPRKGRPNSFWWRRGPAALVRSRRWLWDEATVLPTQLLDRLTTAATRSAVPTGRPAPLLTAAELPLLGNLTVFQRLNLGSLVHRQDQWRLAVRIPAHLSPEARGGLLGPGIQWAGLAPADQAIVSRLDPQRNGVPPAEYAARVSTQVSYRPAEGETFVVVNLKAGGTGWLTSAYLPLPGVGPPPRWEVQRPVAAVVKPDQLPEDRR